MKAIGIIMGIIATTAFVALCVREDKKSKNGSPFSILGFICGVMSATIWCLITTKSIEDQKPSAMDVYQGKTVLEYTVVDGVVTDSTVVWKDIMPQ